MQQLSTHVAERQQQLLIAERKRDARQFVAEKMSAETAPILLRVADARRQRSDAELAQLRVSARTLASMLQGIDAAEEMVPLQSTEAA